MDRRTLLKSATFGALSLRAGPAAAGPFPAPYIASSPTRSLILSSPYAPKAGGAYDRVFRLARTIERAFSGKLKIEIVTAPGGGVAAMSREGIDLHFANEDENVAHEPAFATFAAVPVVASGQAHDCGAWIEHGNGQALWDRCGRAYGLKPILIAPGRRTGGLWASCQLSSLSGVKVTAYGLAGEIAKGLGATLTPVPHEGIATALASGAISATEFCDLEEAVTKNVSQAATTCLISGLAGGRSALSLSIRLNVWESLGRDGQLRLQAVTAAFAKSDAEAHRTNEPLLKSLVAYSHGVRFVEPAGALASALLRVGEAVAADLASRNHLARLVATDFQHFCRRQATT